VATENFEGGLGYLVRSIGQARAGTGALASLLERVSPSFLERLKASTNIEEQLLLVLEAIEAMPDASKRAALANAAFGRTGGDLVLMAEAGAEAIAGLRIEAHRLGLVLDQEAIEAAGRFDDAWIDANNTLRGLRNTVGAALIPAFGEWIAKLSELLVTYRPQIEDWAKRFAEGLPGRLQEARDWFDRMIERLSPMITLGRQLAKSLGWVTLGVGGLSLVVFLAFLPAIIASTKAIFGLGAALLTTPVGWILLGIAAIVAAIVHWEEVLAWLGKAWDWFVGLLDHVFGPALEWWGERIGGVVDWAFESVKAGWARMTGWLSGAVAEVESWIPGWMRDFISGGSNSLDLSASLERADEARADRDRTLHQSSEALVTVQIAGAPPGTTVRSDSRGPLDLRTGVNLGFP
jgi:hypothetical protein